MIEKIRSVIRDVIQRQDLTASQSRVEEVAWLGGGQLVSVLLSVVSVKLMTSVGPQEYGVFTLAASIGSILSLSLFGPLEQGYVRFYFDYAGTGWMRRLFADSLLSILARSIVGLVLPVAVVAWSLERMFGLSPVLIIAAAVMIMVGVINGPVSGLLNAMRQRRQVAIIQVIERILIIGVLFWLLSSGPSSAVTLMVAIAISTGAAVIVRIGLVRSVSRRPADSGEISDPESVGRIRKEIHGKVLGYALPFVIWGVLAWLQTNGERWIISAVLSTEDVGRYGLAFALIANSAVVLYSVLSQYLTPVIYASFSTGKPSDHERGMYLIRLNGALSGLIFLCVGVLLLFAGHMIIPLLSSASFLVDNTLLFILAIGMGVFHVGQTFTAVGLGLKQPAIYMRVKIVIALLSIGLYTVLCSAYGVPGIAWAIVLASTLYLILVLRVNRGLLNVVNPR